MAGVLKRRRVVGLFLHKKKPSGLLPGEGFKCFDAITLNASCIIASNARIGA